MAACAVTIGIAVGTIIGNWGTWQNNIKTTFKEQIIGSNEAPNTSEIMSAIFDPTMITAFIILGIAVDILYTCLKVYTSIGSWVLDNAKDLAIDLVVMAIMGAVISSIPYLNEIINGGGLENVYNLIIGNLATEDHKSKGHEDDAAWGFSLGSLISALIGFIILNGFFEPTLKIESVDLEPYDGEYEFTYSFSWDNFPGTDEEINWVIKLIGNGTVYGILRTNMTISTTYSTGAEGISYLDVDFQTPILDKYRVEVYWDDKLMDSVEKSF